MENMMKHSAEESDSLSGFRAEIDELAKRSPTGDFFVEGRENVRNDDFDVSFLNEQDELIWSKIKDGTIEKAEFDEYQKQVSELPMDDPATASRNVFMRVAANKASRAYLNQYLREGKIKLKKEER